MSATAIADVTDALRQRLEAVVGSDNVHVGPPSDAGDKMVALFLFHLEPNKELRNAEILGAPPAGAPPADPSGRRDVLPMDLRYLVSVKRTESAGANGDTHDLSALGGMVRELHAQPTLGGALLPAQEVRITLEPFPMEELSRIWGLFPQTAYQTSVVYLASPVLIDAGPAFVGPPVQVRSAAAGAFTEYPGASLGAGRRSS